MGRGRAPGSVSQPTGGDSGEAPLDGEAHGEPESSSESPLSQVQLEFVGMMHHELRTPMNGILGVSQLLRNSELTEEQQAWVDTLMASAERLSARIGDLLEFTQSAKHEARTLQQELDLFDLVGGVCDDASQRVSDRRSVRFALRFDANVPSRIVSDGPRLRRAMMSLVDNAVKFTSKGTIEVHISVGEPRATNAVLNHAVPRASDGLDAFDLHVTVRDTGIGIDEQFLPRLFTPFTQADNSFSRVFEGSGMGLALAKEAMSLLDGDLSCIETSSSGSTFLLRLPVIRGRKARTASSLRLDGLRVALIGLPAASVRGLKTWLAGTGADVVSFLTGEGLNECALDFQEDAKRHGAFDAALVDEGAAREHRIGASDVQTYLHGHGQLARVTWTNDGTLEDSDWDAAHVLSAPVGPNALFSVLRALEPQRRSGMTARPSMRISSSGSLLAPVEGQAEEHVLVAEDNAVNQMLAVTLLKKLGLRVDTAANGTEAVERVQQADYAMVFMDCQMPTMDGFEATRLIRASGYRMPIVAVTANSTNADRALCTSAGMDDFIAKPLRVAELQRVVTRWLWTASESGC